MTTCHLIVQQTQLGALGLAIDTVGLPKSFESAPLLQKAFLKKTVAVRGSGQTKALILKDEWEALSASEQERIEQG